MARSVPHRLVELERPVSEAVIVSTLPTPIGTARKGTLRRRGGGIGVAAMCAGGGIGSATVIEVAAP